MHLNFSITNTVKEETIVTALLGAKPQLFMTTLLLFAVKLFPIRIVEIQWHYLLILKLHTTLHDERTIIDKTSYLSQLTALYHTHLKPNH